MQSMKPINYRSFSFYILPFYISLSAIDVSTTFLSPFGLCQRNVVIYVLIAITVITDSVARYKVVALLLSFFFLRLIRGVALLIMLAHLRSIRQQRSCTALVPKIVPCVPVLRKELSYRRKPTCHSLQQGASSTSPTNAI